MLVLVPNCMHLLPGGATHKALHMHARGTHAQMTSADP